MVVSLMPPTLAKLVVFSFSPNSTKYNNYSYNGVHFVVE